MFKILCNRHSFFSLYLFYYLFLIFFIQLEIFPEGIVGSGVDLSFDLKKTIFKQDWIKEKMQFWSNVIHIDMSASHFNEFTGIFLQNIKLQYAK